MLEGTWKTASYSRNRHSIGRIKCGTESNGGFTNIAVTNCVFDRCRGLALETVDGAHIEDVAISNLTMRGVVHSPLFMRLGTRMRGPKDIKPGVLRRVVISNIVSSDAVAEYPSIIAGVPGFPIEDIKISDVYLHQRGGGGADWAAIQPPEKANAYPEADMFGVLPATGFFLRHARNVEFSNVEIATEQPDKRAAFWAEDVEGLDVFRVRLAAHSVAYNLNRVRNFRNFGSLSVPDKTLASVDRDTF
jgi:polygalacturonase